MERMVKSRRKNIYNNLSSFCDFRVFPRTWIDIFTLVLMVKILIHYPETSFSVFPFCPSKWALHINKEIQKCMCLLCKSGHVFVVAFYSKKYVCQRYEEVRLKLCHQNYTFICVTFFTRDPWCMGAEREAFLFRLNICIRSRWILLIWKCSCAGMTSIRNT